MRRVDLWVRLGNAAARVKVGEPVAEPRVGLLSVGLLALMRKTRLEI